MKLVDNWRDLGKMWSVRISAFFAALTTAIASFPDLFIQLWILLPLEIQQQILSVEGIAGILAIIFIASIVARSVKQEKLHKQIEKDDKDENA